MSSDSFCDDFAAQSFASLMCIFCVLKSKIIDNYEDDSFDNEMQADKIYNLLIHKIIYMSPFNLLYQIFFCLSINPG